jgi:phenylacetate-CoA ligase
MAEPQSNGRLAFESPEVIQATQDALVRAHVRYCAERSPYYRRLFATHGIDPEAVRGAADLARIPFTTKEALAEHNPDFLAVPEREIVDVCQTSGTTGTPVAMLQTAADLARLGTNEALAFGAAGLTAEDRVLIAAAIDRCFMAGLAYFLGLTRIGAMVIRAGSASVPLLAELVHRHRPTALVGVPTLLVAAAEQLRSTGADPTALGVRRAICIGEPVRVEDLSLSPLGARLRDRWGAAVLGTYASTEMATTFAECEARRGGHLQPELIAVEIVDETGRLLPPGEAGEVVATPLGVTGMPLLRFQTGDIARLHAERCPCGRTAPRLGPVIGRKAQMLKVRGTTVYPSAVFAALQELDGIAGYYLVVDSDYDLSDRIRVVVGSRSPDLSPLVVAEAVSARTRVKPEVAIVTPEEIVRVTHQEGKRKPVTFIDRRGGAHD